MKLSLIVLIVFSSYLYSAQNIYSVKYESQADVKVFVVDYESQARPTRLQNKIYVSGKENEGLGTL